MPQPKNPPRTHYEYRVITMPREVSITDSRRRLTEEAEHGHWELARTMAYVGGQRRFWLRRKTMQVESTLMPQDWF
jgi:hypothetical protein